MSIRNKSHGISVNGEALFSISKVIEMQDGEPFDGHPPNGMQYPDRGENKRKRDNFLLCFIGKGDVVCNPRQEVGNLAVQ